MTTKSVQGAVASVFALVIGVCVVIAEALYYVGHPRSDHSLTIMLGALGIGLFLVAYRQWQESGTKQ